MKVKAMKAMYKISRTLKAKDVLHCELYTKLFDSMIKPILLYGCQVWSQQLIIYFEKDNFGNFNNLPFEQLHNKLCKQALKVGKFTSNTAVRAELGRLPLLISVAVATISYWINITASTDKLVYAAYREDIKLDSCGHKNWVTLVRTILKRCHMSNDWQRQHVKDRAKALKKVQTELEAQFKDVFFNDLNSDTGCNGISGNKLRTYKLIKNEYIIEPYLRGGLPSYVTRAITKIRIGAHRLEIEKGRWRKPTPTPANERFCRHCKDAVEDEVHFISYCPLYAQHRNDLLKSSPEVKQLSGMELFTTVLTTNDYNVSLQVGIYICRALNKRQCLLYDVQ
jgi:hypothetical protein